MAGKVKCCFRPKDVRTGRRNRGSWSPALVRKVGFAKPTRDVHGFKKYREKSGRRSDSTRKVQEASKIRLAGNFHHAPFIARRGRSCTQKRPQKSFRSEGSKPTGGGSTRGRCGKRTDNAWLKLVVGMLDQRWVVAGVSKRGKGTWERLYHRRRSYVFGNC